MAAQARCSKERRGGPDLTIFFVAPIWEARASAMTRRAAIEQRTHLPYDHDEFFGGLGRASGSLRAQRLRESECRTRLIPPRERPLGINTTAGARSSGCG